MIKSILLGAALLCAAVTLNAQTTYQVRPAPFTGGGYDVYQNGLRTQQIRPAPFTGGGYNVQTYGR